MVGMTPARDNALTLDRVAPPLPMIAGMPEYFEGVPILYGRIVSTWWEANRDRTAMRCGGLIKVICPHCTAARIAIDRRYKRPVENYHGWDMCHGVGVISHRAAHGGCSIYGWDRRWPLGPCADGYYISLDPNADHSTMPGECEVERPMPASRMRGAR